MAMGVTLAAVPVWAAFLPLGAYLAVVGWLHLRHRPVVVTGTLDLALLAGGVSGLVLAGPLALLQPAVGTAAWATAMLLGSLVLIVAGGLLATRPRLVIYNVTTEQLRPILAEVVGSLDATARWAGESVVLPARGLQVLVDGRGLARCVSLVAVGRGSSPEAWAEFARRVRRAARTLRVRRNPWGAAAAVGGLLVAAAAIAWAVIGRGQATDRTAVRRAAPSSAFAAPTIPAVPGASDARPRRSLGP
jgi:hypothetical protein